MRALTRVFGAPQLEGLRRCRLFREVLSRYLRLQRRHRSGEGEASPCSRIKVERAMRRMTESFSGRQLISDATLAAEAVEHIGGTSKLTETELQNAGTRSLRGQDLATSALEFVRLA